MFNICVNNRMFLVSTQYSILEACKFVGIIIPRFCYHESLSIAGNCRMCLVEIDKAPKPVASCATPLTNNMEICTYSPFIQKARESVLEFILLQHPLDCPICDQAGECDLQDQYMLFGIKFGRQFSFKRSVEDKFFTPTIKTIMTRCIHCTRCVRFFSEICGFPILGTLNRGSETEIGTYSAIPFYSELSGNAVDLCPVGALTTRFSSFRTRPWEITFFEGFDLTVGLNSSILFQILENSLGRILPKKNRDINENWISDKIRFSTDVAVHLETEQRVSLLSASSRTTTLFNFLMENTIHVILGKSNTCADFRSLQSLTFFTKGSTSYPYISGSVLTNENVRSNFYMSDCFGGLINDAAISTIQNISEKQYLGNFSTLIHVGFIFSLNLHIENILLNSRIQTFLVNSNITFFSFSSYSFVSIPFTYLRTSSVISFFSLLKYKTFILFNFSKYLFFIVAGASILTRINDFRFLFSLFKHDNPQMLLFLLQAFVNGESTYYYQLMPINSHILNRAKAVCFFGSDTTEQSRYIKKIYADRYCGFNGSFSMYDSWSLSNTVLRKTCIYENGGTFINFEQRAFDAVPIQIFCDFCTAVSELLRSIQILSINKTQISILISEEKLLLLEIAKYFNYFSFFDIMTRRLIRKTSKYLRYKTEFSDYSLKKVSVDSNQLGDVSANSRNLRYISRAARDFDLEKIF